MDQERRKVKGYWYAIKCNRNEGKGNEPEMQNIENEKVKREERIRRREREGQG